MEMKGREEIDMFILSDFRSSQTVGDKFFEMILFFDIQEPNLY